jgi:hypothetical protein
MGSGSGVVRWFADSFANAYRFGTRLCAYGALGSLNDFAANAKFPCCT